MLKNLEKIHMYILAFYVRTKAFEKTTTSISALKTISMLQHNYSLNSTLNEIE
jgi:hypothetical protein